MYKINTHYREVKKLIKKNKLPDSYFPGRYAFSPYMACGHGCKYCDGRAEKYGLEGDFEKDIIIRKNLPTLLAAELKKIRERGVLYISSGISDAYQPVEAFEKLTRKSAEILSQSNLSVTVMTKSPLIQRDLDYWKIVNEKNGFMLMVSLAFMDDEIRQIFEPYTGSVKKRLETLKIFKDNGMKIGVLAMPFLPLISDTEENVDALMKKLSEIGVDFVLPGGLTLRPGRQKTLFFDIIKNRFPQFYRDYIEIYSENRQSGSPKKTYADKIYPRIYKIFDKYNLCSIIPHHCYKDRFETADELFVLLIHLQELYKSRGVNINPLKRAFKRYRDWLFDKRSFFNRRRNLPGSFVSDQLMSMFQTGEISDLIGNRKLVSFLYEAAVERKTFNYHTLKFE